MSKMTFEDLFISDEDEYEYEHLESIEKILQESEDEPENISTGKYKLITRRIDASKIRHKIDENYEIHTSICKNVKMSIENPVRSGAIIYTHHQGKTYFCLGVDSNYGDLTDFAGGVKKDEMVMENGIIIGGLRELEEESLGVFGKLSFNDVANQLSFYSSNMLIMFIKINTNKDKIKRDFFEKATGVVGEFVTNKELEVSDIHWIEKSDFLESISGRGNRLYSRVRKILSKVTEIISAL